MSDKLQTDNFLRSEQSFAERQEKYERKISDVVDRIEEEDEEIERLQSPGRRPSIIDELLDRRNERKASVLSNKSDILKELTKPMMSQKKYSLTDDQVEQFQDVLLNNDHVIQSNDTKMDLVISKDKRNSIDSINSNIEEIERKMSMTEELERKKSISKEYERRKSITSVNERRASNTSQHSAGERRSSGASNVSQSANPSQNSEKLSERKSSDDANSRRVSFELDNVDKNGKRTVLSGKLSDAGNQNVPSVKVSDQQAESTNVKSIIDELNENDRPRPKKFQVETGVLTPTTDGRKLTSSNLATTAKVDTIGDAKPARPSMETTAGHTAHPVITPFTAITPHSAMKQLINPNNDTVGKLDEIALRPTLPPAILPATSLPPKQAMLKPPRPMSSMEEESLRERSRIRLLRQIAEYLETIEGVGSKFNKESFRRVFLNKVRLSFIYFLFFYNVLFSFTNLSHYLPHIPYSRCLGNWHQISQE